MAFKVGDKVRLKGGVLEREVTKVVRAYFSADKPAVMLYALNLDTFYPEEMFEPVPPPTKRIWLEVEVPAQIKLPTVGEEVRVGRDSAYLTQPLGKLIGTRTSEFK